jgi:hypothetical protein
LDSLYPESDRIVNRVDGVSILRTLPGTDRKAATKVWRNGPDGPVKENFGMAARFDYEFQPCQNIRDLSLILKQLNNDPYAMVIRGELADGVDPRRVRRKTRPDESGKVWINPCPRPWLFIDFDAIPCPPLTDLQSDPEAAIDFLIGTLPDEFHDASCHWQLSSSAGFDDDFISAHVWFWLDNPLSDDDAIKWANWINDRRKEIEARAGRIVGNLIDPAVFRTVQPNYTAAPIFDGVRDPLPRRYGFREGLSDAVKPTMPPAPKKSERAGFYAKLNRLGDGMERDGFNYPLIAAAASYVASNGAPGPKEAKRLKDRLRAAIQTAPKEAGRDVSRYQSDEYLDDIIKSAARKYSKGPVLTPSDAPPEASEAQTVKLMGNPYAFALFMFLASKNQHGKPVYIDRRKLAPILDWSPTTVDKARRFLEAENWLKWVDGGEQITLDDGTKKTKPKTYVFCQSHRGTYYGPNNWGVIGGDDRDISSVPRLDWINDARVIEGDIDD